MIDMQQAVIAALRALIVTGRWPTGRLVTRQERTWLLNRIRAVEKVVNA